MLSPFKVESRRKTEYSAVVKCNDHPGWIADTWGHDTYGATLIEIAAIMEEHEELHKLEKSEQPKVDYARPVWKQNVVAALMPCTNEAVPGEPCGECGECVLTRELRHATALAPPAGAEEVTE